MPDDATPAVPAPAIPAIVLERYAIANQLARAGQTTEALAAYESVVSNDAGQPLQGTITGEFLAQLELHKGCCYQALENDEAAIAIFAEMDRYLAGQLDMADLYTFYLAYGNSLGAVGRQAVMDDRLARAMNIALDQLDDWERFRDAWYKVLYWDRQQHWWSSLAEHSQAAYGFALQHQDVTLQLQARAYSCFAERGLRNYDAARQTAGEMLTIYRQVAPQSVMVEQWEAFLYSLP